MVRVTADSNVYISALLNRRGKPTAFVNLARDGYIRLAVSDNILAEVAEVLQRKFKWPAEKTAEARSDIESFAQKVRPSVHLEVIKEDPDDDRILECASAAGSDLIVTGDKDLLRLGIYDSIRIITLADFFAFEL